MTQQTQLDQVKFVMQDYVFVGYTTRGSHLSPGGTVDEYQFEGDNLLKVKISVTNERLEKVSLLMDYQTPDGADSEFKVLHILEVPAHIRKVLGV